MDSRNLFPHFAGNDIPAIQTEQLQSQALTLLELLSKSSGYPYNELFDSDFFKKDLNGNYFLLERCLRYLHINRQLDWSPEEIGKFIHLLDVKDFFANSLPDFSDLNENHASELAEFLNNTIYSYVHCLDWIFHSNLFIHELKNNYDLLAQYAGFAFLNGEITREQIGTLLEIIEIKKDIASKTSEDFVEILIFPLLKENEFTYDTMHTLQPLLKSKEEEKRFRQEILQKPPSEQSYYVIQFKNADTNPAKKQILQIASRFKIMYPFDPHMALPVALPEFQRFTFQEANVAENINETATPPSTYIYSI